MILPDLPVTFLPTFETCMKLLRCGITFIVSFVFAHAEWNRPVHEVRVVTVKLPLSMGTKLVRFDPNLVG
jgi:hypothetical protein